MLISLYRCVYRTEYDPEINYMPRGNVDLQIESLAKDIKENGMTESIEVDQVFYFDEEVYPNEFRSGMHFLVNKGLRRCEAMKLLGAKYIEANIVRIS